MLKTCGSNVYETVFPKENCDKKVSKPYLEIIINGHLCTLIYALGVKFVQAALTHQSTMSSEMSVLNYFIEFNKCLEV